MITNEERIDVLSRIEKIMAHTQTESGAVNVNEMAIANRLVKELMDKYEISIDEIRATSDKSTLVKNIESELIDQKGIRHWVMSLSSIVASFYECPTGGPGCATCPRGRAGRSAGPRTGRPWS